METIKIETDFIKLDSLMKFSGLTDTSGTAKQFILEGKVKVNAQICLQRNKKIKKGDSVEFLGQKIIVE